MKLDIVIVKKGEFLEFICYSARSGFKTPFLTGLSILRRSKPALLRLENSG
jgi:hypothetical protein